MGGSRWRSTYPGGRYGVPTALEGPRTADQGSNAMIIGLLVAFVLVVLTLLGAWLILGPGPRRRRAVNSLQARLDREGDWAGVLSEAQALLADPALPPPWKERVRKLAADCHVQAGDVALKERRYE